MVNKRGASVVKNVALIGIMAAIIECAKLALAALPNIEAVSLLISLFSFVFGWVGVAATFVFVCIEPLIWGIGTWFISYLIYWPMLAVIFFFLGRLRIKNRFALTGIIISCTVFFGILTSFVDVGLFSGSFDNLFYRFSVYYSRGVVFYIVHTVSNAFVFLFAFKPLLLPLYKIKSLWFPSFEKSK